MAVGAASLIVGLLAVGQEPVEHPPVPRVAGTNFADFSTCQACHVEKTSGPVLHPATEMGCETCHTVDYYRQYNDIYLALGEDELCFTCHEDRRSEASQLTVHSPVRVGKCSTCHDPHGSDAPHLLKQGTDSLEPTENLCLSCHKDIAVQIARPVQHAAIALGCSACHTTHKSEPAESPEGKFHLAKPLPALCLDCHDAGEPALREAHHGQPFDTANCTECHSPHGSEAPKLINTYAHMPFTEGMCDVCHAEPVAGKVVLVEGGTKEVCLACHDTVNEQVNQAKVPHMALEMGSGCVACHSPHAASHPAQLRQGPVRTCLACHADLAEAQVGKEFLHRPVFETSCVICHQPHGGERSRLLRAEVNDLCMECHTNKMPAMIARSERLEIPVKLFGESVELNPSALKGIRTIQLFQGNTKGHPFLPQHPTSGKYPKGDNMNCTTCHLPHAGNGNRKLFVTETREGRDLCQKCH